MAEDPAVAAPPALPSNGDAEAASATTASHVEAKAAGANGSAETFMGLTGEAKAVEAVAEAVAEVESEKKGKKGKKDKKEKEPAPPSVPFLKLFSFSDPLDWLLMLIGSFGAIIHGAALPVFFLFFGKLINSLGTGDLSAVPGYCLYFVYLGLVVWLGGWLEVSCWMQAGERQGARIRQRYLGAVLKQEVAFFDMDASSGEIVSRVSSDVLLIQDAISEKVGNFLHFFATFVAGFIVGFSNIWQLSLVTLAVMPMIVICGGIYAVVLTGLTSKGQEAYAQAGRVAEQAISQVRTVFSFAAENRTVQEYMKALEVTLQLGIQGGLSKGLGMGGVFGVMFCAWALLFWYASQLVDQGITNGGAALTTMFAVLIGALSLGQAMPNLTAFAKGQAAAYTVFSTIERKSKIDIDDEAGEKPATCTGDIELRDVHFSYPARPDMPIFQGFSLSIKAGSTVAIVGSSGSGKSTVIALIERFYDPASGSVHLDGHDLRSLNLRWLRSNLGLVSQEPALFATSIKENIMYGKEGATMEEVEAAAKAANAHSFISAFPKGYDTEVGERGTQMSGGQKQRIAIARALLRNPAVLLLDEATSALDAESERVVQEALDAIMGGRTTIVIAHRLSTIRKAGSIAVVSKGKLVEQGTHDELMALAEEKGVGEYSSLVKMQSMAASTGGSTGPTANKAIELQASALSEGGKSADGGKDAEEAVDFGAKHKGERNKGTWLRLFQLSLPELPYTLLACLGAALAGSINPIFGLLLTTVVAAYYNPDLAAMHSEVNKYAIVFACLGFVSVCVYTLQHYFFGVAGEHLVKRVRERMLSAILRNEVSWFDHPDNSSGAVAARLASDATLVKAAITDRISVLVQNLSLILVAFIISFILNWRMSLVVIATFPLLVVSAGAQQAFLKGFAGDQEAAHASASKIASEAVGNIRTVAALHMEDRVLALFTAQLAAPLRRAFLRGQLAGTVFGFTQFVMFAAFGLGLWYGSTLIPENASFDQVIKVFMVLIMTSFAIAETLTLAPDIAKGGYAIESVFNVLDRTPEMVPDDPKGDAAEEVRGDIELKHVTFAYPTRPDVTIFNDFSLKIPVGKTVALVGASGSGKSSVVALIERFYDPQAGRVFIDGKDIRDYNLRLLRAHIGLVSQEPALFATTIRENILYGRQDATEAEVVEAAKAANAYSFISSLPKGLDTDVGERGTQLSGGQKQRIAIARAVLKNPAILLLDEATSALDAESEKVVQDALDRLMVGRSTVVIAHRLSTIKGADIIAVVQEGKIIEKGDHNSLIGVEGGAYFSLVHLQQSKSS